MMNFDEIVVKESPGLCRCCLSEGCYKDMGTDYTWMSEREVYADMLLECFDISVSGFIFLSLPDMLYLPVTFSYCNCQPPFLFSAVTIEFLMCDDTF